MTQPESPGDGRRAPLPPELRTFGCESALPDPLEAQSSAKTVDGSLPGRRSVVVLNEKDAPPQCQKLVRWTDLFLPKAGALPAIAANGRREAPPDDRLGEAIHCPTRQERKLDCFVASAPLRKRFAFVAGNDAVR